MDAHKLPQALNSTPVPAAGPAVPFSCLDQCIPSRCRPGCSLEAVDELLATAGALTGQEADSLLDLRQMLRARADAEGALRLFCRLRERLEERHYLVLYRLRRWLENHIVAEFCPPGADAVNLAIHLSCCSSEAVRRRCLCAALQQGHSVANYNLKFKFRALEAPGPSASELSAEAKPQPGTAV